MSPEPVSPKPETAKQRAADAEASLAVAQARQRRAVAGAEYEASTRDRLFTKRFNTALEAAMRDELATVGERFMAWLQRYSWGEYALYAIGLDGLPRFQVDCARELGVDKSKLSHVVAYYVARGFVRVEGKMLYPVIAPALGPAPQKVARSDNFSKFLENWKVANSDNFHALEVARSTVERIRKVILSDYRKLQKQATKAGPTLLEIARHKPDPASSQSSTPFEEDQRRKRPTQPGKPSRQQEMQSTGRDYLFAEVERMQNAYKNSAFASDPIDRQNPSHQTLIDLILKKLGDFDEEYLVGYVVWVAANFKGLSGDLRKRQRAPGKPGGPETLGLLVNWAEDYARVASEQRARETARNDDAQ